MKDNTRFILGIVAFLVLVFVLMLQMPRQFNWSMSFHHDSDQPFGCKLFDQLMEASLPNGYEVSQKTFPMLVREKDSLQDDRSYLVFSTDYSFCSDSLTIAKLFQLARSGDKIFLLCGELSGLLSDSLFIGNLNYNWFSLHNFRTAKDVDTIYWHRELPDTTHRYVVPEVLIPWAFSYEPTRHVVDSTSCQDEDRDTVVLNYIYEDDPEPHPCDTLMSTFVDRWDSEIQKYRKKEAAVLVHYSIGEGDIYVSTMNLIFTNYGMLEGYDRLIFDVMPLIADRPVVRLESYIKTDSMWMNEMSPTRHFLAHPPLKWALRLTVLAIVLFMVFTARRRQRIEPVVEVPKNRQMEFIQLIGTLYHQRHDNADLVSKKYKYFAEEVRRLTGIDITDEADDEHVISALAEKTGLSQGDVKSILLRSRLAAQRSQNMDDRMMCFYIDEMNRMMEKLTK